jgi:uncharacterized protein (TIGR04222 family)
MNPLDLRGPEFLQFYLLYGLGVLTVAWLVWLYLRSAAEPSSGVLRWSPGVYPREGDAYEIALLRGGAREAARMVLGRLVSSGLSALDGRKLQRSSGESLPPLAPVESAAYGALAETGGEAAAGEDAVRRAVAPYLADMEDDLQRQGLALSAAQVRRFERLRLLALLAVPGLGLAKLVVALSRGRTNVGFLVLMTIGYAVAMFFLLRPPTRTRAGERYLSWLRESHQGLVNLLANDRRNDWSEMALVAGIYGLSTLPVLGTLDRTHRLQEAAGSGSGYGSTSGDFGSSHSGGGDIGGGDSGGGDSGGGDGGGGDGGGGGGCGGGGCGGCGGGG